MSRHSVPLPLKSLNVVKKVSQGKSAGSNLLYLALLTTKGSTVATYETELKQGT